MIKAAIKNRRVTIFMMIIIFIFGIYSYYIIPKQEDPNIEVSVAILTTIYPGAPSDDVEKLVTRKIEEVLPEIDGYDYSTSTSKNSVSVVVVRLTADADVEKAWEDLRQEINDVQKALPDGVQETEINTHLADTAGMLISLSGANYSYEQLEEYAEILKKGLVKIDGIARFEVTGKQKNEVKVEVDADRLNFYSISLAEIIKILQAQNIEIPSGSLGEGENKINVKIPGTFHKIEEIENTIVAISKETGAVVRLRDIAKVYMGLEESNFKIKHNSKNAVLLTGYFKPNKNIVITGKDVEKKLKELKSELPRDIAIDEVLYQPREVDHAIKDFMINLLAGILIVVAVVFISMGLRNAVIVSVAIPMSLLLTFSAMYFIGIEIHQISIGALIIALGMLVDNAIVISDSIQVKLDEGEERFKASLKGAKEVGIPVLTSTMTTVFAFIPLLMLPGMAGEFIKSLPQIIMISLSSSYLVAMLISPMMAFLFFKPKNRRVKTKKLYLRGFFDRLLQLGLKYKKSTLFISIILFGLAVYITSLLGLQFFPKADKNMMYIDIMSEKTADIEATEKLVSEVERIVKEQPEITSYTSAIGGKLPKFYFSVPPGNNAQDRGQTLLKIDLSKGEQFKTNTELADYIQEILNEELVGGKAIVKELEQGEPIGAPVVIRITGEDMDQLAIVAEKTKSILKQLDGTINIEDNLKDKIYDYYIQIDTDKASTMGITKYDVQREVNIALKGQQATVFREQGNEYGILVKSNIRSKEALDNLKIKSSVTGFKVLLKDISKTELKAQLPTIEKFDRELAVTVLSDVKPGYSSIDIQNEVQKQLDSENLSGVSVVFDGEQAKIKENFSGMGEASIFAILIIFVILLVQFNSITQPFIILLTIPLSLVGSIVGLYVLKQPLSFTALLGIVSLMGIVVNNAIILIDYINGERANGKTVEEASKEATRMRFRPVMLTTSTTVIGLFPLALSGSNLFVPMSIALISGLLVSTLLTLVIIPVVYSLIESRFEKKKASKVDRKEKDLTSNPPSISM